MSQSTRASTSQAARPWAMKFRVKTQRTKSIPRLRDTPQDKLPMRSEETGGGDRPSSDEVSSPRSRVGALSKDESFIGLVIVTALVSTNRFFQKLSGLMSAVDVASDSTALGTAESREQASSETSAASTRSRTSASGVPTALMNVMLQPDTGETRISLSSTDRKRGPSEGEEEQSQGFFDVAAFVVRDAIVGNSSDASSEGVQGVPSPPTSGAIFPLANEADADASSQGRIDEAAPRQWMSASESRASTGSNRASVQKGETDTLEGSKEFEPTTNPSALQQRPGGRRSFAMQAAREGAASASGSPTPVEPTFAGNQPDVNKAPMTSTPFPLQDRPGGRRASSVQAQGGDGALTRGKAPSSPVQSDQGELDRSPGGSGALGSSPSMSPVSASSSMSKKPGFTGRDLRTGPVPDITGREASKASGAETWPDRVWPQPPAPLGSMKGMAQPAFAATGAGLGGGGEGGASGSGASGGGSGGMGNGGSRSGEQDDGSDGRFPWVPVLFFLLAASTYPILRGSSEGRDSAKASVSKNPFTVILARLFSFCEILLQPLRGEDRSPASLRVAQQDAYALKVADHQRGSESRPGDLADKLSGTGKRLPECWGGPTPIVADQDENQRQKWWLIIPLLAAAGFAGYAWYKHTKNAGGDGSSAAEEELKTDTYPTNVTGAYPKQENPDRPASSASASNTDVSGQTPRSKDPSAESGPSTRSCRHDDYLDPRHVRHVDISQSFLSAANAFQTEE